MLTVGLNVNIFFTVDKNIFDPIVAFHSITWTLWISHNGSPLKFYKTSYRSSMKKKSEIIIEIKNIWSTLSVYCAYKYQYCIIYAPCNVLNEWFDNFINYTIIIVFKACTYNLRRDTHLDIKYNMSSLMPFFILI